MRVRFELVDPELFSCPRIERPEAVIDGAANEDQSSRGGDRTSEAINTGLGNPFRFQIIYNSQRRLPGDFPGSQIDSVQVTPRRLLARIMVVVPKARVSAPLAAADVGLGGARRLWLHKADRARFAHIHEKISERGVERAPRPVAASQSAGHFHAHIRKTPGSVDPPGQGGAEVVETVFPGLWSDRCDVVKRHGDLGERRRLDRKRLRRPSRFARHFTLCHRPLFHREQWLAGEPIENKNKPHFGYLRHRRDFPPLAAHGNQIGRRGHIVIPDVVVHHLVIPEKLARGGIQCHQGIPEKALTFSVRSIKIVRGRPYGKENHPPLHVHAHDGPHIGPRTVFPGITFPGLVSSFAGSGDGVEPPDQLSGTDIKGANVSAGPFRREFLDFRPCDDQVFVNRGRRS